MSGSAGFFRKKNFFYLVGSPKVGGAGDGKHKKKYGHPNQSACIPTLSCLLYNGAVSLLPHLLLKQLCNLTVITLS